MVYIMYMRETNIRSVDLNLLVALKALLDEQHVTHAAEKIGLSQPAMSRALGRLRVLFKDPLLVKGASGLGLTARANALYQPLENILAEINQIITPPDPEPEPLMMEEEIVIATRDNEMVSVLPKVINYLENEAPGITLNIIQMVGNDLNPLENNEVDFILTGSERHSATLHRHFLYQERFCCLFSASNPVLQQEFTLKKYLEMKHCLVTITGSGPGIVDKTLAELGLTRKVAMRVPHFLAASFIVAESNLVVTLPHRVGLLLAEHTTIVMRDPPIAIRSFPIYLYWHARNQNNPVHRWLRQTITKIIG